MRQSALLPLALSAAVALAAPAPESARADEAAQPQVSAVPDGLHGFRGQLLGRLISKDVEKGSVILQVVRVSRVWKNNKAPNPKSAEGKTFLLEGITGRFLDELLAIDPGQGIEIEAKHVRGENLEFLGEGLKKVPVEELAQAREAAEREINERYPGFRGMLTGKVASVTAVQGRLNLEVTAAPQIWKESRIKDPKAMIGKTIPLEVNPHPIALERFLPVLKSLKAGDVVEAGVLQVGESRYLIVEELRKFDPSAWREDLRGFRGILVGKLIESDAEKGTLTLEATQIKRQWPQSKARRAQSAVGHKLKVEGISGRFLDVLLTLKPGERIEVEAFDHDGENLRFPGEWLKKAE